MTTREELFAIQEKLDPAATIARLKWQLKLERDLNDALRQQLDAVRTVVCDD